MPIVSLNWETVHLNGEVWISHHRLRHRVFVDRQGWEVPAVRNMEYDCFDTPAAEYLMWTDHEGEVRGVARLLPTVHPYMIQSLWSDLVPGELPQSPSVWEATRFGVDETLDARTRRQIVAELLCAMQEFGLSRDINYYLAVMPVRLLNAVVVKAGWPVTVLGPERQLGKLPAAAAHLAVSSKILADLRRRANIRGSVLRPDISIAA